MGLGVLLALTGCSSIRATADYDRTASFGSLHTYAWRTAPQQGPGDPRLDNSLLDARVKHAVDRELEAKGYRKVSPEERADFLVGYHVVLQRKVDVQTVGTWYGYRGAGLRIPETRTYQYEQGTLLLDVVDPTTTNLIWRGTATAVVDPDVSTEKRERRIAEAVAKVLADFPPR